MTSHHNRHDKHHHDHHDKHHHGHHHLGGQHGYQQNYSIQPYGTQYAVPPALPYGAGYYPQQPGYFPPQAGHYPAQTGYEISHPAASHHHKRNEHLAEVGALAAGAFAMHEHHQVKVDPAHAARHRTEEAIAGMAAVGLAGYALHEHHLASLEHKAERHDKHHKKHHHRF